MSQLTVRSPKFHIDETVPFQWQPANPSFGLFGNVFTFLAIAFERYIVSATRQAEPYFTNPVVAEEADLFVRQEAQHARAHRAHAKAMIAGYPGLEGTYAAANAAYDELLEREDVEFHLAYVACLEATFTPLFKMVLDHRRQLFEGSDERVGTMLLWHFVEEIEHRSSALVIHHDVTPDRSYRVRKAPKVLEHVSRIYKLVLAGFEEHVPIEDRLISTQLVSPSGLYLSELRNRIGLRGGFGNYPSMLGHVPGRDLGTMLWRETKGQMPRHDPAHEPLPAWAERWHEAFNSGADVTTYEGVGALT
ncbi:MAG: metal-dependent hydrolase [Acidimicrobiales bacterium]|nr:metal-dependent hydrolase [Acidimicrobiales bacterium]